MDSLAMPEYNEDSPAVNFLSGWPPARRSGVAQLFYVAVREGATTPSLVIESVRAAIRRPDVRDSAMRGFVRLASLLDTPDAQAFARYCIEREQLPPEEKATIKKESREHYKREYLKAQPPTQKQLDYLRILNCDLIPRNRLEASELIDERTTRGVVWP